MTGIVEATPGLWQLAGSLSVGAQPFNVAPPKRRPYGASWVSRFPVAPADRNAEDPMTNESTPSPLRTIVLVGLMGSGKSSVGRRLASRLGLPFRDADEEIEAAAGLTIADIFEIYGEPAFRDVEQRVITRLLGEAPMVLATGGGAFMDADTRQRIRESGLSIWLRAELDILTERTARRDDRPLLNTEDPREVLERLIAVRYPVYAEADIVVDTGTENIENTVDEAVRRLEQLTQTHAATEDSGR